MHRLGARGSVFLRASGCLLLKMRMSLFPCCSEGMDVAQVLETFELEVQKKWKSFPFSSLILFGSQNAQMCRILGNQLKDVSGLSRAGIFKHFLGCSP